MSPVTDFPRSELAPSRHQQVRAALVREVRTAYGRRVPRRVVPVLAGLSVLGVGTAVALPTTGLGTALGTRVGSLFGANPCPPSGDVGYRPERRRPTASDDTAGVRFLPPGTPSEVTFRMESDCPLPERDDRPVMRPDPRWTIARIGADGKVDAVVTAYFGLPDGISRQVADRTSQRLPTDGNDPGTVLDPPFRAVEVRGTTGTLAERPAVGTFLPVSLVWTEGNGREWSLQSFGLTASELVGVADRLEPETDGLVPGEKRVFRYADVAAADLVSPFWYRFDVPSRPDVTVGEVSWSAYLFVRTPGRVAGTSVFTEVRDEAAPWQDWRTQVRPGDGITDVDGREAVVSRDGLQVLTFDLPDGAHVVMSLRDAASEPVGGAAAVTELQDAARALTAVPADDPRLRGATLGD